MVKLYIVMGTRLPTPSGIGSDTTKFRANKKSISSGEGLYTCYKIYGGAGGGYVQVVKTSGGYVHKFNGGDYVHLYKNEQGYCHTLFYS